VSNSPQSLSGPKGYQKGGEATFTHGGMFGDLTEAKEDFDGRRLRL